MGLGAGLEHGDPALAAAGRELGANPALADAGLTHHADRLALARKGQLQSLLEVPEFPLASHEPRQAPQARDVEGAAGGPNPAQDVDPNRFGRPPDLPLAEVVKVEIARDEPCGLLGQAGAPGLGYRLHPLREPDGMTEGRVLEAEIVAHRPDDDLAGVEAEADRELDSVLAAELRRELHDGVENRERRVAGPSRVVLVSDGGAEQRHRAVPGELVDGPLEAVDRLGNRSEQAVHDRVPSLGIDPLRPAPSSRRRRRTAP